MTGLLTGFPTSSLSSQSFTYEVYYVCNISQAFKKIVCDSMFEVKYDQYLFTVCGLIWALLFCTVRLRLDVFCTVDERPVASLFTLLSHSSSLLLSTLLSLKE